MADAVADAIAETAPEKYRADGSGSRSDGAGPMAATVRG